MQDTTQPDPMQPEPTPSGPRQPEPMQIEPTPSIPTQPEPKQPEPTPSIPTQPEPIQPSDAPAPAIKTTEQPNNHLHGKTLEAVLTALVEHYGWKELGSRITINCFNENPSIQSSLKFLRRMPWARKKVEDLYLGTFD